MSRVLPAELKTNKVKSLSGDLRDIAEELIAKKFGIKEEVIRDTSRDHFRQEYPRGYEYFEPGIPSKYDVYTGPDRDACGRYNARTYRVLIRYPSISAILRGLEELDQKWVPANRTIVMGRDFWMELKSDPTLVQFNHRGGRAAEIFGCYVDIRLDMTGCYVQGEF